MKKILISLVAMVATAIIWPTFAATEITPLAAFAETSWSGRPAANVISNSGLSSGLQGTDASTMWMGSNSGNTGGASFARWFVVDLGSVRPLGNMKVWNFNMAGYPKRGLKQIDVYVADTDAVFSGTPDFTDTATWTLSKENLVLSMAPGSADYAGETACNFGGTEARWVGFWIDELFESSDDWSAGGGYGGLSKVKFYEYEMPAEILDPSQFTYRAPVTFPGYTASGTLDNFPVLVRLTETVGGFSYDDSSADGSDIRFALEDGTVLPSEVALWNPDGESLVWVGVPSLSSDASVWLYWGKTHSFPASQTDGSVWTDAGYFAVWHMDEAVGATTTADSAGGTFDGTHVGTTPGQEGKVGRGVLISNGGWNDAADRGKGITTAAYAGKGDVFTLTSWLKYKSGQNPGTDRLISSKSAHTDTTGWEISFQRYSPRCVDIRGSSSTTAIGSYDLFPNNWMGSWQHLGVVFNGGNVAVFLNGSYKTYGTTAALVDTDRVLTIGSNVGGSEDSFKGTLDEMRLRQGRSTDAWIAAEYNSVNNASFAAIGAKELLDSEHDVALLGAVSVSTAARHSATISWVLRTASSDASATVTAYYGTDPNALSSSATLASGAAIATGVHESTLSGLTCATAWYVKLVATGRDENSESEVVSFKTAGQPVFGLVTGTFDDLSVTLGGSLADAGAVPIDVTAYFGTNTANWTAVGQWTAVDSARAFEATTTAPRLDNYVAGFRASGTCPDCGAALAAESDVISVTVSGECRWTGAAGDLSWNTPGNWSSGTVPGPMDTAVFPAGSVGDGATIALDANQSVAVLLDQSGVSFQIGSADDVSEARALSVGDYVRSGEADVTLLVATPVRFAATESGTNLLTVAPADSPDRRGHRRPRRRRRHPAARLPRRRRRPPARNRRCPSRQRHDRRRQRPGPAQLHGEPGRLRRRQPDGPNKRHRPPPADRLGPYGPEPRGAGRRNHSGLRLVLRPHRPPDGRHHPGRIHELRLLQRPGDLQLRLDDSVLLPGRVQFQPIRRGDPLRGGRRGDCRPYDLRRNRLGRRELEFPVQERRGHAPHDWHVRRHVVAAVPAQRRHPALRQRVGYAHRQHAPQRQGRRDPRRHRLRRRHRARQRRGRGHDYEPGRPRPWLRRREDRRAHPRHVHRRLGHADQPRFDGCLDEACRRHRIAEQRDRIVRL